MKNQKLVEFIQNNLFYTNGDMIPAKCKTSISFWKQHEKELNEILEITSFLDHTIAKLQHRIFCIINNINEHPKCIVCGKNVKYHDKYGGYFKETCCKLCGSKNPKRTEKTKQTNLEKYGVENVSQNDKIKKKISDIQLNMSKEKKLDKLIKTKETKLKNYDNENFTNREKAKQTNLERHGDIYPARLKKFKDKSKNTMLKKYGMNTNHIHISNLEDWLDDDWWYRNSTDNVINFRIDELSTYFNITANSGLYSRLKKLGIKPMPMTYYSNLEKEVVDFIKTIYNEEVVENTRKIIYPKELDIYIPKKKLAIEFNGLFWHSSYDIESEQNLKNIHKIKTNNCEAKDIQLLHIFENEWIYKKDIWKSVIRNKLNLSEKIYARKCKIKEIDSNLSRIFLENNHLQGNSYSKYNYGLFYNDELVSIITFNKSRYNKNYDFELIRFCNKLNITVVGGFSKLLKNFRCLHQGTIISYANRRWSNGNLYYKNGFELINITSFNYFYFQKDNILYNRQKFQKYKLVNLLDNYDKNLTESENMYNNNYRKIFDSGNKVFILN